MMSKLKAYANTKKNTKTTTITARIPNAKYEAFKEYCDELGISISEAINVLIDSELKPNTETKEISPAPEPIKQNEPSIEETHFILRKTAKTRTETQNRMAQLGPYQWVVMEGNKSHYDKDNNIIPIRFTAPDGEVCEPDADELKELEEAFGKPVHIEK